MPSRMVLESKGLAVVSMLFACDCHSGMRLLGAGPESILAIVVMDSGLARFPRARRCAIAHRGMTTYPRFRGLAQTETIRLSACRVLRARRSVRPTPRCCA